MTGYGRGSATGENFNVTVDLKTVNNRFLDVHLRTSTELSSIEANVRRQIGESLSRGRVDASVTLDRTSEIVYELNRPMIAGFIEALRSMQQEFQLAGEPDVNVLARLPGVMHPIRDGINDEMIQGIERAIAIALEELDSMRGREGASLASEMRGHLDQIESLLPIIELAAGNQLENYRARLQKRIADLIACDSLEIVELDQSRLAQEVAYLADRSDITEEIARLKSHLNQFRQSLDGEAEVGKRLDFLLQELNREANTMLAKSTDFAIKEASLKVKAEIEKLREQVQNVE